MSLTLPSPRGRGFQREQIEYGFVGDADVFRIT